MELVEEGVGVAEGKGMLQQALGASWLLGLVG